MDIPKYFSNVVLSQFKATGIPLKVYVNDQYLIIPDMYEISDPLIGSGMTPAGDMIQFDYREIDHLLVGGNVIDLATYTKAMIGDTPEEDAKENEAEDEAAETTEESLELGEITKDVLKARQKALDAEEDALKDKQKALKDEPITEDGLWANIHAKRKRGEKPAPKGSKAYKAAKKAGDKINNESVNEEVDKAVWSKASDDQRLGMLLTIYDDPDEAELYVDSDWNNLPPEVTSNLRESVNEEVDRPEEKKIAILNAIAKEEKRSEFQNRILNQIKRAIVDGEPLFKLPFKTQADYRKLMKMYKIPFSSKKAEKGNLRAESVNEAWIGPFVFGNTTKDDELKAMYDGALDGYANWKSGMVHPRADYKKAYQTIEKLLKRRGIQVESINELTYTTYWMGLDVRPPSYGNSELHTIAMELFGKKDFSKLSQSQKDKVVSKIPGDKKLYKTYGRGGSKKLSTESIIKKGSYVTNNDGLVGRVDNISGDKEIADIRYNDGKEESLPIKNLKIFENNYTFGIGDIIKNKNTSCPHHGSIGIVQKIMQLGADNPGKIVKYRVVNSGPTYKPGDVLSKTIDQLEPMGL